MRRLLLVLAVTVATHAAAAVPVVTTTADEGAGSLREAIVAANQTVGFQRVVITFQIAEPLPPRGFYTIQPRTPLPAFLVATVIDGASQKDLLGVRGGAPLIFIDGSLLDHGDALTATRDYVLQDLAIGNFPGAAISRRTRPDGFPTGTSSFVTRMHLGVTPDGAPAPNERGVFDIGSSSAIIADSVISANRRSGVWIEKAAVRITGSRIGVAPASDAPRPNGASGVFLNNPGTTRIENNVIANNAHFGLAVHAREPRSVEVRQNSIYNNAGMAIDYLLNGPDENLENDAARFPNAPVIRSATYDAATNTTAAVVDIATTSRSPLMTIGNPFPGPFQGGAHAAVELYANGVPARQLERFLARVFVGALELNFAKPMTATIVVAGDLRGQWLTAVTLRYREDCYTDMCNFERQTSEPSAPLAVF